ncbi:MAG: acyl-CoA dehydrogenase [Deltaproteobacteria bacterium]|nr:acyl-CoA dehydrogenase [Deltaproteobacteria bacterium]
MELSLTPAQEARRDAARAFAEQVLSLRAAEFEREERVPQEIYSELAERGLMAVNLPEELGGSDAGVVAYALSMMEIARGCASTAVTMAVTNMVGEVIARFGTEAQRARYCPLLAAGRHGAFALSEVDAGSDPGAMRTRARRDGDDWILDGTKQWISHGDSSAVLVVWARTGEDGPKGLSCFLVPEDAEGLVVDKHEDKMGLRGSHTCALAFSDLRLPADALLGEQGAGFPIAMMALDGGRIGIASQALGIAQAAHDFALAYLKQCPERAAEQDAQFLLADMRTRLAAGRLLVLRAALLKERHQPFSREASMAKLYATEGAFRVTQMALSLVGAEAESARMPLERHMRDVRVTRIYEGTSEVQRIVIARHVLSA